MNVPCGIMDQPHGRWQWTVASVSRCRCCRLTVRLGWRLSAIVECSPLQKHVDVRSPQIVEIHRLSILWIYNQSKLATNCCLEATTKEIMIILMSAIRGRPVRAQSEFQPGIAIGPPCPFRDLLHSSSRTARWNPHLKYTLVSPHFPCVHRRSENMSFKHPMLWWCRLDHASAFPELCYESSLFSWL